MLPDVPREYTQFISLAFIIVGLFLLLVSASPFFGVACIGVSCWVLMMSESILHNKIQLEMSGALEGLRKKQESEIQDLLYFLREMQKATIPFESLETTKAAINKIVHHPAIILDVGGAVVDVSSI